MLIVKQQVQLINEPDMYKKIELAGRVCYKSEDRITDTSSHQFCNMLERRGHLSVFEHWRSKTGRTCRELYESGFSIEDIAKRGEYRDYATVKVCSSIQVLRQLLRHRKLAVSQESTRYCRYENGIAVLEPLFNASLYEFSVWEQAMVQAEQAYLELLSLGAKPEEAASVLPMGTKSEAVLSATYDDWDYIFSVRTQPDVFPQTIELVQMIQREVNKKKEKEPSEEALDNSSPGKKASLYLLDKLTEKEKELKEFFGGQVAGLSKKDVKDYLKKGALEALIDLLDGQGEEYDLPGEVIIKARALQKGLFNDDPEIGRWENLNTRIFEGYQAFVRAFINKAFEEKIKISPANLQMLAERATIRNLGDKWFN